MKNVSLIISMIRFSSRGFSGSEHISPHRGFLVPSENEKGDSSDPDSTPPAGARSALRGEGGAAVRPGKGGYRQEISVEIRAAVSQQYRSGCFGSDIFVRSQMLPSAAMTCPF